MVYHLAPHPLNNVLPVLWSRSLSHPQPPHALPLGQRKMLGLVLNEARGTRVTQSITCPLETLDKWKGNGLNCCITTGTTPLCVDKALPFCCFSSCFITVEHIGCAIQPVNAGDVALKLWWQVWFLQNMLLSFSVDKSVPPLLLQTKYALFTQEWKQRCLHWTEHLLSLWVRCWLFSLNPLSGN